VAKSHWGAALAKRLQIEFIDLDQQIEDVAKMRISQIFEESGEEGFRILEAKCLRDLAEVPKSVVATGGGTPCFYDNMEWMNQNGTSIYLKAPAELLAERLWPERHHRPLIAQLNRTELEQFIQTAVENREQYYLQTVLTFDVTLGLERLEAVCGCIKQVPG
jgi:Shikimate kinase